MGGYEELEGECHRKKVSDTPECRTVPLRERPRGKLLFNRPERGDVIIAAKSTLLFGSAEDCYVSMSTWHIMGVGLVLVDEQIFGVGDTGLDLMTRIRRAHDAEIALRKEELKKMPRPALTESK